MQNKYDKIVIDGANILHDDTGIEMKDDNGEKITQIRPERLKDVIDFCEKKGWSTIAFVKTGTYKYARSLTKNNSNTVGDINILNNLIEEEKVRLIPAEKEDIYFIDYAIRENSLIITHDKFKAEKKEYEDRNWKDIDNRTLRDHKFINDKFILPSLKQKEIKRQIIKKEVTLDQIFTAIQSLRADIADVESYVRKLQYKDIKKSQDKPKTKHQEQKSNLDIVNAVVNRLLSSGDAVSAAHIQAEVARPILSLEDKNDKWKAGWSEDLRHVLGYSKSGGFAKWLISNSKKEIKQNGAKLSYA